MQPLLSNIPSPAVLPLPCGHIIPGVIPEGAKNGISEELVHSQEPALAGSSAIAFPGMGLGLTCARLELRSLFLPLQRYSPCPQLQGAWQGAQISLSLGISLRSQCRSLLQVRAETWEFNFFFKYSLALTAKPKEMFRDISVGLVGLTSRKVQLF